MWNTQGATLFHLLIDNTGETKRIEAIITLARENATRWAPMIREVLSDATTLRDRWRFAKALMTLAGPDTGSDGMHNFHRACRWAVVAMQEVRMINGDAVERLLMGIVPIPRLDSYVPLLVNSY